MLETVDYDVKIYCCWPVYFLLLY